MYQYHVKWWCEDKILDNYGLVAAGTFKDAVEKISNYYGDREIEELFLEVLGDAEDLLQYKNEIKNLKDCFEV